MGQVPPSQQPKVSLDQSALMTHPNLQAQSLSSAPECLSILQAQGVPVPPRKHPNSPVSTSQLPYFIALPTLPSFASWTLSSSATQQEASRTQVLHDSQPFQAMQASDL